MASWVKIEKEWGVQTPPRGGEVYGVSKLVVERSVGDAICIGLLIGGGFGWGIVRRTRVGGAGQGSGARAIPMGTGLARD